MAIEITSVKDGGPSARAGIRAGMKLVSIDGREIRDVFDYEYYSSAKNPVFTVETENGLQEMRLDKDAYDDVGVDFGDYLMDRQRSCTNSCIFCFIDQLPKGLREPLYFKDDDERLSFLFGNYTTLTNLKDRDIDRIIEMRISPINISVHTTEPDLRCMMMGNRFAGKKLEFMYRIAEAGLDINAQIVSCRDVNDGEQLRKTLTDLVALYPSVQSIAVVPAGLTRYRDDLYPLQSYDAESAAATLDIIEEFNRKCREELDIGLVYPSDEWYLLSGRELPGPEYYDDYLQIENGVGMTAQAREDFFFSLDDIESVPAGCAADFVTGESASALVNELAAGFKAKFPDFNYKVHTVKNDFFGGSVTVAGLLTGTDIKKQVPPESLVSNKLILPGTVLRNDGDLMLDDTTPEQLREYYRGINLFFTGTGSDLLSAIIEECEDRR